MIEPLLPVEFSTGRGRPWGDQRRALEGMLWILRSGARWEDLPAEFGSYKSVHRRFQSWVEQGVLDRVLHKLAEDLRHRGGLDLTECFVDATFVPAKRGALESALRAEAKGPRSWRWSTAMVFLSLSMRALLTDMKVT